MKELRWQLLLDYQKKEWCVMYIQRQSNEKF